jgi:putative nucleotidyltransferase with HDIG domain
MAEFPPTSRLRIVHVRSDRRPDLPVRRSLGPVVVDVVPVRAFARTGHRDDGAVYVFDVDLRSPNEVRDVLDGLGASRGKRTIFVLDSANRVEETQALALGGNALLQRPIDPAALEATLRNLVPSLPDEDAAAGEDFDADEIPAAIGAGTAAMSALFDGFRANTPPKPESLRSHSRAVDDEIDSVGLDRWITTVRNHHRGTYQHSLLVSGIASRFGLALGLPPAERQMLTAAALVHDIGKIRISTQLLDKIGPLNDAEFAIVKRHPEIGSTFLAGTGLDPRILTAVRHHHEYLDGSGYPDGLSGSAIPSVVRMLTICDVFGALVEQRSYKLPLPSDEAYRRLEQMAEAGLLDTALVAAFRATAAEIITSQVSIAVPRAWISRDGIRHG